MATVIPNTAKAVEANLVGGLGGTAPNYMGIGTGAGTSAVADTTLFTEYAAGSTIWTPAYARTSAAPTRITTTLPNDTLQWVGTFTVAAAQAQQTITNAGMFDSALGGTNVLVLKGDFTGIPLNAGDSLQLTQKLQYT